MSKEIYLSLGSNLGDRRANLKAALSALDGDVDVTRVSSLYETEPVGGVDQPLFLNIVVAATTGLSARELLARIKAIEREIGRRPTVRWGPRVVDIDILLMDTEIVNEVDLQIPHREMVHRAFVLVPLSEIAPQLVMPNADLTIAALAGMVRGHEGVHCLGEL